MSVHVADFRETRDYFSRWLQEPEQRRVDVSGMQYGSFTRFLYPLGAETVFEYDYPLLCRMTWWLPYPLSALYVLFVFGYPKIMKHKPLDLKPALRYWNLFLAIFSFIGAIRTVPHLFINLYRYGWRYQLCAPPEESYGMLACGLWVMFFAHSKYVEFGDTVFKVLLSFTSCSSGVSSLTSSILVTISLTGR